MIDSLKRSDWTYALKLVIVAVKVPSAAATIGVDVSSVEATLILPHSLAVEGRWTSDRAGVPATPRAGAIAAWACALSDNARTKARSRYILENMARVGPSSGDEELDEK